MSKLFMYLVWAVFVLLAAFVFTIMVTSLEPVQIFFEGTIANENASVLVQTVGIAALFFAMVVLILVVMWIGKRIEAVRGSIRALGRYLSEF
jgi:hypothetical protein